MQFKLTATAAIAALALLGLSACGGEQSVSDACKVAQTTVASAESEITEAMSGATSGDYASVAKGFNTLSSSLKEATDKISNEEVKTALTDFQSSVDQFAGLFDGIKDDDMTALAAKASELEAVSTKISESTAKLSELCPAS